MGKKKKKITKSKKTFHLLSAVEALEELPQYFTKPMFGGLALYARSKMMIVLMENPGEKEYRGITYPFEIWNGVLLPTFFEFQESLKSDFPQLIQHPVLKKWLYLPQNDQGFEASVSKCVEAMLEGDERFGIFPKMD